jgi:hypothetical protein
MKLSSSYVEGGLQLRFQPLTPLPRDGVRRILDGGKID